MSVWFAPEPPMPPVPELERVVADWRPSMTRSVVGASATAVSVVSCLALVAARLYDVARATLPLALLFSLGWAEVRRSYMAVGDDWLFVRTRLLGGGWTSFAGLQSGKVTGKGGTTLLLLGPGFRGRLPVADATMRRPTRFHEELAHRVLAEPLELSAQARFVLQAWAGIVTMEVPGD